MHSSLREMENEGETYTQSDRQTSRQTVVGYRIDSYIGREKNEQELQSMHCVDVV